RTHPGVMQTGRRPTSAAMTLPHRRASEVMTHGAVEVGSSTSLRHAGRMMIDNDIHRVFVTEGGELAGVICAVDLTAAVRDARIETPVSAVMTSPIVTIDIHQPLSAAVDVLDRFHVTGLIVTDDGHPIGMFHQATALASREPGLRSHWGVPRRHTGRPTAPDPATPPPHCRDPRATFASNRRAARAPEPGCGAYGLLLLRTCKARSSTC